MIIILVLRSARDYVSLQYKCKTYLSNSEDSYSQALCQIVISFSHCVAVLRSAQGL